MVNQAVQSEVQSTRASMVDASPYFDKTVGGSTPGYFGNAQHQQGLGSMGLRVSDWVNEEIKPYAAWGQVSHEPMKVRVPDWLTNEQQAQQQPQRMVIPAREQQVVQQQPQQHQVAQQQQPQQPQQPRTQPRRSPPRDIQSNPRPSRTPSPPSCPASSRPSPTPSPPSSPASSRLEPNLNNLKSISQLQDQGGPGPNKWWTRSRAPLVCPLTQFPINLLPYPPFKLRVDPEKPSPLKLVDGKYLAMRLVIDGQVAECGRELCEEDVAALDAYIHRCKLGPFRPGHAVALANEIMAASNTKDMLRAGQELRRLRAGARAELGRLRRIQENRLLTLKQSQRSATPNI